MTKRKPPRVQRARMITAGLTPGCGVLVINGDHHRHAIVRAWVLINGVGYCELTDGTREHCARVQPDPGKRRPA